MDTVVAALQAGHPPTIVISGTKNKLDSKFTIFAVYVVDICVNEVCIRIHRRFNQFQTLDNELRVSYPKVSFPELPRKRLFRSSTDKTIISSRVPLIQKYLNEIIKMEFVTKSTAFINWISSKNNPIYISLDDPDFAGTLIKQGHVVRNWKERYFVLKDDLLYYFRSREDISPLGVIPLKNSTIEEATKMRPLCFKITPLQTAQTKLQPFFIQTQTIKEFHKWIEVLNEAIKRFSVQSTETKSPLGVSTTSESNSQSNTPIAKTRHSQTPTSSRLINHGESDPTGLYTSTLSPVKSSLPFPNQRGDSASAIEKGSSHKTALSLKPRGSVPNTQSQPAINDSTSSTSSTNLPGVDSPWRHNTKDRSKTLHMPRPIGLALTKSHNRLDTDAPPSPLAINKRRGSDSYLVEEATTEEKIRNRLKLRAKNNALSLQEQIYQAKLTVDDELVEYLSSINLELVKSQFLSSKRDSDKIRSMSEESFLLSLKNIAESFLTTSADDLCKGDTCKTMVNKLRELAGNHNQSEHTHQLATNLLFIISLVSRLVFSQRYESKRNFAPTSITGPIVPRTAPNEVLIRAITFSIRFLLHGLGVSVVDTLEQAQLASLSVSKVKRTSEIGSSFSPRTQRIGKDKSNVTDDGAPLSPSLPRPASVHAAYQHHTQSGAVPIKHGSMDLSIADAATPANTPAEASSLLRHTENLGLHVSQHLKHLALGDKLTASSSANSNVMRENLLTTIGSTDEQDIITHVEKKMKGEKATAVDVKCQYCDEPLAFHVINDHAKYCQQICEALKTISGIEVDSTLTESGSKHPYLESSSLFPRMIKLLVESVEKQATNTNNDNSESDTEKRLDLNPFQQVLSFLQSRIQAQAEEMSQHYQQTCRMNLTASQNEFAVSKGLANAEQLLNNEKNAIEVMKTLGDIIRYLQSTFDPQRHTITHIKQDTLEHLHTIKTTWQDNSEASVFTFSNTLYRLVAPLVALFPVTPNADDQSTPSPPAAENPDTLKPVIKKASVKDFILKKPISCGAFGRVDMVQHIETQEIYAMKTLKKRDMVSKNLVNQVFIERNILTSMENPYVVKMYYAFHTNSKLYLLMEYLPGGDLASLLENVGYFEEDMARVYIAETIMAIDYVHSKDIVHRDVKPDNLLITADGHIKLTDFGLSLHGLIERNYDNSQIGSFPGPDSHGKRSPGSAGTNKSHRVVGTPDYLAPEALIGTGGGKLTIDWWAVGVTLFEFLTGIPPFNADTPEKIFQRILSRDIDWPLIPEEMSYEAADLIDKLLCENPQERLGARGVEEIKRHKFFEDINWDTLYKESRGAIFVPRFRDKFDTGYFIPRKTEVDRSFADTLEDETPLSAEARMDIWAGWSWINLPSIESLENEKNSEVTPTAITHSPQPNFLNPAPEDFSESSDSDYY